MVGIQYIIPIIMLSPYHFTYTKLSQTHLWECIGRYELHFPYIEGKVFKFRPCTWEEGMFPQVQRQICYVGLGLNLLLASNLLEMFLLGRSVMAIKHQTDSVASILARDTLHERRR